MNKRYKNYLINLIVPAVAFGSVTGILTAIVITSYKQLAGIIIGFSEKLYELLRDNLWFCAVAVLVLSAFAFLYAKVYKKWPEISGGGIPTSIGILRGIVPFRWLLNLIGTFIMSILSFFIGVPLGNEGPSVQMGTAIGRGSLSMFAKKHRAWDRYTMTGGACSGFSVATGAPVSGIIFAIEEAHQRISPMIVIVSSVSVMFSYITTEILHSVFGIENSLFERVDTAVLSVGEIWIPLMIGLVIGLFSAIFLRYYKTINKLFNKILKNIPLGIKIFGILILTLFAGILSDDFISTGHHLIISLFTENKGILMLLIILLVRSTLTLSANTNGITGGMFLPIMSLGAVLASAIGRVSETVFGLGNEYYTAILLLGITACISGMMKMPVTAVVFSLEALYCYNNILSVITVSATAYIITEIFSAKSINDDVLENKVVKQNKGKSLKTVEMTAIVQENSFAVGKQIRDIFWPANLFVLSVQRDEIHGEEVDEHGGTYLKPNDKLHIRYASFDNAETLDSLSEILGEQDFKII